MAQFSNTPNSNSQVLLKKELLRLFEKKRKTNPQLTYKIFAKSLSIQPTSLSEFLNGKRRFSTRILTDKLKVHMSPLAYKRCLNATRVEAGAEKEPVRHTRNIFSLNKDNEPYLDEAQANFTKDPWCYVLMICFELQDFDPSYEWFKNRTGLSITELKQRLDLLARLGILEKTKEFYSYEGVRPIPISARYNTTTPDHAKTLYELALKDASSKPYANNKNASSALLFNYYATNPNDFEALLKEIDLAITRFRKKHVTSKASQVYAMNINFFPVTKLQ